MDLTIQVERYQDEAVAPPVAARFNQEGGTIGRGPDNRLVLSDPMRHVSRVQAAVKWQAGRYQLENVSSANVLFLNDAAVEPGQCVFLADGDVIKMGLYMLRVGSSETNQVAPPPVVPAAAAEGPDANPFASLFGAAAEPKVSADPLPVVENRTPIQPAADAKPAIPAPPTSLPDPFAPDQVRRSEIPKDAPARPANPAGAGLIPEDFDPFAQAPGAKVRDQDPLAQGDGINWSSIDDFLSPSAGKELLANLKPEREPLAPVDDPLSPNRAGTLDPLALFGGEGAAAGNSGISGTAPRYLDHVSEMGSFFSLNPVEKPDQPMAAPQNDAGPRDVFASIIANAPAAPGQPSSPDLFRSNPSLASVPAESPRLSSAAAAASELPDADALMAAFARGARLPPGVIKHKADAAFMETLGAMMFESTQGVVELLAARNYTKRELRAEVTMIGAVDNNPFKFLPNAESVLAQMFGPKLPGFAPPVVAMRDAWIDLRTHQLAVMAGMRAALIAVLGRFEPKTLAARVAPAGLDAVFPGRRNTRLWEEFVRLYDAIQAEAEDQFETAFGEAFLSAYQSEIERLGKESFRAQEY